MDKGVLRSRGALAVLLLIATVCCWSCAGKNADSGDAMPEDLPADLDGENSEFVLGADGRVVVTIRKGGTPVKRVIVEATGQVDVIPVGEAGGDAAGPPTMTATSFDGRDLHYLPLRRRSPLAYSEEYVIGPGDEIGVAVWRNDQLTKQVQVRPDGRITLPLVNDLTAAGLTRDELQKKLIEMYREFIATPEITVTVVEANSYQVVVQGRVTQPGAYPIQQSTTLVQAVAMAGGFTEWADRGDILIIRRTVNGEVRLHADYKKIIRAKNPAPDVVLQPGDTVVVGP